MCTGTAIGGRDGLGADMLLGNLVVGVYAGRSHGCGAAVIDGGELGAVLAGEGLVLHLVRSGLYVALVGKLRFLYTRPAIDAAGAIEAGVVVVDDGVLLDDGSVDVDVGDVNAAEVGAGAVIGEGAASPLTAEEADTAVAEAVVDAAVEADVGAPVANVPYIGAA